MAWEGNGRFQVGTEHVPYWVGSVKLDCCPPAPPPARRAIGPGYLCVFGLFGETSRHEVSCYWGPTGGSDWSARPLVSALVLYCFIIERIELLLLATRALLSTSAWLSGIRQRTARSSSNLANLSRNINCAPGLGRAIVAAYGMGIWAWTGLECGGRSLVLFISPQLICHVENGASSRARIAQARCRGPCHGMACPVLGLGRASCDCSPSGSYPRGGGSWVGTCKISPIDRPGWPHRDCLAACRRPIPSLAALRRRCPDGASHCSLQTAP